MTDASTRHRPHKRILSRWRLDLFLECQRCSYLAERLGVQRPRGPSFTLNNAVDALLKKEYDYYREHQEVPPLLVQHGIVATPLQHPDLERWRNNHHGIRAYHPQSGIELFGAVDDVWVTPDGELIIVDFKATSKTDGPSLEGRWGEQYKRQLEVYQWLFMQNGFSVHPIAFIVYVNAKKEEATFANKLHFEEYLFPHEGDTSWIEPALMQMHEVLERDEVPPPAPSCEYCAYRNKARNALRQMYARRETA